MYVFDNFCKLKCKVLLEHNLLYYLGEKQCSVEGQGMRTRANICFSFHMYVLLKVAIFPEITFVSSHRFVWLILVVSSASSGPCCAVTMTPRPRAGESVQKTSIREVPNTLR